MAGPKKQTVIAKNKIASKLLSYNNNYNINAARLALINAVNRTAYKDSNYQLVIRRGRDHIFQCWQQPQTPPLLPAWPGRIPL